MGEIYMEYDIQRQRACHNTNMVSRFETFVGNVPQSLPSGPNNSFVHESFPPGNKLSPQRQWAREFTSRRQSVFEQREHVRDDANTRTSHEKLPHLPYSNNSLMPRKHATCAFVNNHKTYLRLKGFQLKDVYSLKRRKGQNPKSSNSNDNNFAATTGGAIDLPAIPGSFVNNALRKKRSVTKAPNTELWVPSEARKVDGDDFRNGSLKGLDGEIHIPGHVRRDFGKTNRLGKVLTNSRLKQILTEEEPVIPKAFYMDSSVSPRNGVSSSLY